MNTIDDFDEEQWHQLCTARLRYVEGTDKGTWWRVLRLHGYTGGDHRRRIHYERMVDEWLRAHPGWVGRYSAKAPYKQLN